MKKLILLVLATATCTVFAAEITVDASQGQTIQLGVDQAKPSDTVIVKPGIYPEMVTIKTGGEPDKPITLKAEKPGTVHVDGSDAITGWQKVAKSEDVGGAPNWKNIFFVEVPDSKNYANMSLYEDDSFSAYAQDPVPTDPFNNDRAYEFMPVDEKTYQSTSITDPKYFHQKDLNYWDGATVIVWTGNNNMRPRAVKSFDPATGTIHYDSVGGDINPKVDRFAMVNHLDLIRNPGEYVVRKSPASGKNTLYYWPFDAKNLEAGKVRSSARKHGILINAPASHLVIEGFDLRGHHGPAIIKPNGEFSTNIVVRNNHVYNAQHGGWGISMGSVHHTTIENNYVHHIQGGRGIGITGWTGSDYHPSTNSTIRNNRISHCGSTGINFYNVHDSSMIGNTVHDNFGHHGNGLTCYLSCRNILIEGNNVFRSNMALTMQQGDNMMVRDNILIGNDPDGNNTVVTASYANNMTNVTFENNVMMGAHSSFHLWHNLIGYVIRDNVLQGLNIWTKQTYDGILVEYNLIVRRHDHSGRDPGYAERNVFETDISKVFIDAANGDFRRVKDGLLMQAGLLNGGRKIDLHPSAWEGRSGK